MSSLDERSDRSTSTYASQVEDYRRPEGFDSMSFLEGLSEDAATVLKLVVESPVDLATFKTSARSWRSLLKKTLSGLGWTGTRIADCFEEIQSQLVSV